MELRTPLLESSMVLTFIKAKDMDRSVLEVIFQENPGNQFLFGRKSTVGDWSWETITRINKFQIY